MVLPTQPAQGMAWSLLRAGTYVYQATCDLTSYSVVPFLATGAIPQSVIGGSGQVAAREMGIDNTGNSKSVSVMVGKLYTQNVPPYTQTTIELGDTAPMIQVTGGGVCLVTFSTTTVPGTEAATNPYAAALGAIGVFLPSGVMMMFAGPVGNVPTGWQLCDGSALSRANQPGLYAAIGTLFGAGDGSSTFNVPDLRGRFPRGFDNGAGIDNGRVFGSYQAMSMQTHYHRLPIGFDSNQNFYYTLNGAGAAFYGEETTAFPTSQLYTVTAYTGKTAAALQAYSDPMPMLTGSETRPINVTVNFIIKL